MCSKLFASGIWNIEDGVKIKYWICVFAIIEMFFYIVCKFWCIVKKKRILKKCPLFDERFNALFEAKEFRVILSARFTSIFFLQRWFQLWFQRDCFHLWFSKQRYATRCWKKNDAQNCFIKINFIPEDRVRRRLQNCVEKYLKHYQHYYKSICSQFYFQK